MQGLLNHVIARLRADEFDSLSADFESCILSACTCTATKRTDERVLA